MRDAPHAKHEGNRADEPARSAGTGCVHPLFGVAREIHHLRVLATKFDDGVGVGVDSDIATEPAPAQRGDTATWHCVSIDGEPRNWITRPVLADMDELSIIVEEG